MISPVTIHRLVADPLLSQFLNPVSGLFSGVACLAVGLYVLWGATHRKWNRLLFFWMLFLFLQQASALLPLLFRGSLDPDSELAEALQAFLTAGGYTFVLHLALIFPTPGRFLKRWWQHWVVHLPLLVGAFATLGIAFSWPVTLSGLLFLTSVSIGLVYVGMALLVLETSRRESTSVLVARQIRILQIAAGIPLLAALVTGLANLAGLGHPSFIVSLAVLLQGLAVAYGVLIYQVVKVRIRWGHIINTVLTGLFLVLVYVGTSLILTQLFSASLVTSIAWNAIMMIVALLALDPLRNLAGSIVEHLLPGLKWQEISVHEVYWLTPDGRVVHREGTPQGDPDITAGMLTAVKDFCQDAFGLEERQSLSILRFGEFQVLIEHSPHLVGVVIFSGSPDPRIRTDVRRRLRLAEEQGGRRLADWTGDPADLEDVIPILTGIIEDEDEPKQVLAGLARKVADRARLIHR